MKYLRSYDKCYHLACQFIKHILEFQISSRFCAGNCPTSSVARGTKRFLTNVRIYLLIEAKEETGMIQRLILVSIIQWAEF